MSKDVVVDFLLNLDDKDFNSSMETMQNSVKNFLKTAAPIATGSVILKKLGSAAISMGLDFEQSFAKVETLFGSVEVNTDNLTEKILELSTETGIAATSLNEGLYSALSAGIPVTEDMSEAIDFLTQASKLSVAGFTDIEKAVDVSTTVLNAYGLEVSETESVMNTLIETQNAGKTTVDELASSIGQAIPGAAALGVNFEELSASVAVLTANGIGTAEAVTKLKSLFSEMIDPTSDVNILMEELGEDTIPTFIANGGNLQEVLAIVNTALGDQGKSWYELMGTVEAADAAQVLMKDGGVQLAEVYDRMTNSTYELNDAYTTMQTPAQNLAKIQEGLKNSLIEVGNAILEFAAPALEVLADNIEWIGPIAVTATAGIGVLLIAIGSIAGASAIAGAATIALGGAITFLTSPITLTVAGITALVIAFQQLYTHSEALVAKFDEMGGALGTLGSNFVTFTTEVINNVISFLTLVWTNFTTFIGLVKGSWDEFWTTFRTSPQEAFAGLIGDIGTFFQLILENLGSFGELLSQNIATFFTTLGQNLGSLFSGIAPKLSTNLETLFTQIGQNFQTFGELFKSNLDTFGSEIKGNFKTFGELATNSISEFWNSFRESPKEAFAGLWEDLKTFVGLLVSNVKTFAGQVFTNLGTFFTTLGQNIKTGFSEAMSNIGTAIDEIGPVIKEKWQSFWDSLPEIAIEAWNTLNEKTSELLTRMTEIVQSGTDKMNEIFEWAFTHQDEIVDMATDAIIKILEIGWNTIITLAKTSGKILTAIAELIVGAIISLVVYLWEHKEELFRLGIAIIQLLWEAFWETLKLVVSTIGKLILSFVEKMLGKVRDKFDEITENIKESWDNFWDGLYDKTIGRLDDILDAVVEKGKDIRGGIEDILPGNIGTDYSDGQNRSVAKPTQTATKSTRGATTSTTSFSGAARTVPTLSDLFNFDMLSFNGQSKLGTSKSLKALQTIGEVKNLNVEKVEVVSWANNYEDLLDDINEGLGGLI